MKSIAHMDLRALLPLSSKDIWEDFEGTPEECYAWGLTKRDEFMDLCDFAWDWDGFTSVSGDQLILHKNPHDFMMWVTDTKYTIWVTHDV